MVVRISDADGPPGGPPGFDARLARLAGRQYGVVTLAQLRALGLGPRGVAHRAARGRLHRLHRGVYAVGHTWLTLEGQSLAALLACGPGAVLSHRSAAAAWGLRRGVPTPIEASTALRGRSAPAGVELHRTRSLPRADVTRARNLPVTTVARTLVDLAGVLTPSALGRAVHEAEFLRLLDVAAVEEALGRANGRRGTPALRAALTEPSPGATRSALEERFLALVSGRLPAPRCNAHLQVAGELMEVDVIWRGARVVVELDGAQAHRTRRAFHRDRARDLALAAEGWVVVRLTWQQVTREPERVIRELQRLLAVRGGQAQRPGASAIRPTGGIAADESGADSAV